MHTPVHTPRVDAVVPRPAELDALRQAVLGENAERDVALTALRGMGGVGKTTLAAVLCHDELVASAFPDGIFWITVGREPGDLAGRIADVGALLDDLARERYATVDAAAARLTQLLHRRSVLLVLDDVWDAEHVRPLLLNLPQCRTLLTTRDAAIGAFLRAREVRIGSMEPWQSVELLRRWSGRDDPLFPEIAASVGHLPLALRIVAANLTDTEPAAWLRRFRGVSQLRLDRDAATRDTNVEVALDLSVERLRESDRDLYASLGIFPDDVRVPLATVTRLWRHIQPQLDDEECAAIVKHLARRELLEIHGDAIDLHDVLRLYVRGKLGAREAEMHRGLLAAYNADGRAWSTIADDGYLHGMLLQHLDRAGDRAGAIAVLRETTPEGRNGWYEARRLSGGLSGYLRDVQTVTAWARSAHDLPLQIFCALCACSVSSLAVELPSAIIVRLVETGIWDVARAVEHVRQIAEPLDRASILHGIAPNAKPDERRRLLLDALSAIDADDGDAALNLRNGILGELCRAGFVDDAMDRIRRFPASRQRPALETIASWIREPPLRDAALAMLPAEDVYARIDVMLALLEAGSPPGPEFLESVVAAAEQTAGTVRGKTWAVVLPRVADQSRRMEWTPRAFGAFRGMPDRDESAREVAKILPLLVQDGTWTEAVRFARDRLVLPKWKAKVLTPLARLLPEATGRELLNELHTYVEGWSAMDAAEVLIVLASGEADPERQEEYCRRAMELTPATSRELILQKIAAIMPERLASHVLDAALAFGKEDLPTTVVTRVLERFPRPELVRRAVDHYLGTYRGWELAARLLPMATGRRKVVMAWRAFKAMQDAWSGPRKHALLHALTAVELPADLTDLLIDAGFAEDLPVRRSTLSRLAPWLNAEQLARILVLSGSIGDDDEYSRAIASLLATAGLPAGELPVGTLLRIGYALKDASTELASEASGEICRLLAARNATNEAVRLTDAIRFPPRHNPMIWLAPRLPPHEVAALIAKLDSLGRGLTPSGLLLPLLPYASAGVRHRTIEESLDDPREILGLLPFLDEPERRELIPQALDDVALQRDWQGRYAALQAGLPFLDRAVVQKTWDEVRDSRPFEEAHYELRVLLASRLGEAELAEALDGAGMLDKPERADVLARAVQSFPRAEHRERVLRAAISAADSLKEHGLRAVALLWCALATDGTRRDGLLERAFVSAAQDDNTNDRAGNLYELGPFLWENRALAAQTMERILPICAARTREELLGDLAALRYTLHLVSNLQEVTESMGHVREWWP